MVIRGPKLPGVQDFLRFDVHRQEVVGQTHHQLYVVGAGGCDHLVALLQRERHGLLDQYVLAGVERIHAQPVVQVVTEHNAHGVDLGVLQQFRVRGVALRDVVGVHVLGARGLDQIGAGHDLHVVQLRNALGMGTGNAAQANHSNSQHRAGYLGVQPCGPCQPQVPASIPDAGDPSGSQVGGQKRRSHSQQSYDWHARQAAQPCQGWDALGTAAAAIRGHQGPAAEMPGKPTGMRRNQ